MADREELDRVVAKSVSARELSSLDKELQAVAVELAQNEQVMLALTASDVRVRGKCLVVATSRQLLVAGGERLLQFPYDRILDFELNERWRKAELSVRAPGVVVDLKDIHLDRARELAGVIRTGRKTSQTL